MAVGTVLLTPAVGTAAPQAPTAAVAAVSPSAVKAAYGSTVRDGEGRIDVAATIGRAAGLGVTTYQYLVYNAAGYDSAADWADLPAFLSAAASRGIDVWVYLVGPSEASTAGNPCSADNYPPFRGSYANWFRGVGALAAAHRNLTAIGLDDLPYDSVGRPGARCATFTPENLAWLHGLADAAAHRHLPLYATYYLQDLSGPRAVVDAFRGALDGAVLPYNAIGEGTGDAWVDVVTTVESCRATTSSTTCLTVWLPPSTAIPRGSRGQAVTGFTPTATSGTLSFAWADSYLGASKGAVLLQVLVGTRVVWQGDVASNGGHRWRSVSAPLTGLRPGVRTTLTVRVLAATQLNNFGASVKVDGLTVRGGRLGGDALHGVGWTTSGSGGLRTAFRARLPIQWMVYGRSYHGITPTAATVTAELGVWKRHRAVLGGVTLFQVPLDPSSAVFAAARAALV